MCLCNSSILWLIIHHRPLFLDFKKNIFLLYFLIIKRPLQSCICPILCFLFLPFWDKFCLPFVQDFHHQTLTGILRMLLYVFLNTTFLIVSILGGQFGVFKFFFKMNISVNLVSLPPQNKEFVFLWPLVWLLFLDSSLFYSDLSQDHLRNSLKNCVGLSVYIFLSVFLLAHGFLSEGPPLSSLLFWMLLLVTWRISIMHSCLW